MDEEVNQPTLVQTWLPLGFDGHLPPIVGVGKLVLVVACFPQLAHINLPIAW